MGPSLLLGKQVHWLPYLNQKAGQIGKMTTGALLSARCLGSCTLWLGQPGLVTGLSPQGCEPVDKLVSEQGVALLSSCSS